MQVTKRESLEQARKKFVGEIIDGKMTDKQRERDIRISSIQSKLNHAKYHLVNLLKHYDYDLFRLEEGQEILRAEFSAFLFAISGSIDVILHEVNILYGLNLNERNVKLKSVITELKRGNFCGILHELSSLQGFSWYKSLNGMRNKTTHNPTMIWTFYIGGDKSGKITIPENPFDINSPSKSELNQYCKDLLLNTESFIDNTQDVIIYELP